MSTFLVTSTHHGRASNIEEVIGRQGDAMLLLRVLQLMCGGDKPEVPLPSLPSEEGTKL